MPMFRARALAAAIAVFTAVLPAAADDAPDPVKVKRAADEFDLGVAAFKAKNYDEAAQHFEAADENVQGVKSLRLAIRARSEAGHGSRAATLAAQALERYADDGEMTKLARETIDKLQSGLHKVKVSCASPCVLAVGSRAVPGVSTTRWVVFLDPGRATLSASFAGKSSAKPRSVEAVAGGSSELRFEPPEPSKQVVVPSATSSQDIPPDMSSAPTASAAPDQPAKGIHPAFFGVGLGLTAAAGGVLAWSGIDTLQNPGPDKVRQACAGKGPDCPEYKLGLESQLRTNILIGGTAGLGAITLMLAIFTRWSGGKADDAKKTAILPSAVLLDRGAAFGVTGVLE